MFTVALIGPDGAGKSMISKRLVKELPLPAKTIYMGVNMHSSNVLLPTTRLVLAVRRARGRFVDAASLSDIREVPAGDGRRGKPSSRPLASARSGLRLANWLAEEVFRQAVASYYRRRGNIVIFDRHFLSDYYASDIEKVDADRRWSRSIHAFFLRHVYPKPDLVVCLDAPADVLYARKPEGTIERLEERRREYLHLHKVFPRLEVVDASGTPDEVTQTVARAILDFSAKRRAARRKVRDGR